MAGFLKYKTTIHNDEIEYRGTVEYNEKDKCLEGRVIGIQRKLPYKAHSIPELQWAFEDVIRQYSADCNAGKEKAEIPYKGNFSVRIPPKLHQRLGEYALRTENKNLNTIFSDAISEYLDKHDKMQE